MEQRDSAADDVTRHLPSAATPQGAIQKPSAASDSIKRTESEIEGLVSAATENGSIEPVEGDDAVTRGRIDTATKDAEQDIELKAKAFQWVSTLVTVQVLGSTGVIFFYMCLAAARALPWDSSSLRWWIAGAVVEVLGLAYVIVRYLFGGRNNGDSGKGKSKKRGKKAKKR